VARRRSAFERLAARCQERYPQSLALTREAASYLSDLQFTSIDAYLVTHFYLVADDCFSPVDGNQATFNESIRFAPRTKATFTDEFIKSHWVNIL
jgi:hypothetical protein